jgi:hypothetical protein
MPAVPFSLLLILPVDVLEQQPTTNHSDHVPVPTPCVKLPESRQSQTSLDKGINGGRI